MFYNILKDVDIIPIGAEVIFPSLFFIDIAFQERVSINILQF